MEHHPLHTRDKGRVYAIVLRLPIVEICRLPLSSDHRLFSSPYRTQAVFRYNRYRSS